jgi:hypothetical protein
MGVGKYGNDCFFKCFFLEIYQNNIFLFLKNYFWYIILYQNDLKI